MADRILYQFTLSPFAIKVRKILDYKSLPYRTIEVNPFARGEVVRVSGQRLTPVLVDPGRGGGPATVHDSTAIAEYLESTYPEKPVYPRDPAGRARVALLEDWSDEAFSRNLVPFKIFTPGNAKRMVDRSRQHYPPIWYYKPLFPVGPRLLKSLSRRRRAGRPLERLRKDYEEDLDRLEALAAAGRFLAGDDPTVFDFAVWGLLATMEGMEGEDLMRRRGRLGKWYDTVGSL